MWTELNGTHATDPLYILLAREDEGAAEEYAAGQDSDLIQHNLHVELEAEAPDMGDTPFSIDTEGADISNTSDQDIDNLLNYLSGKDKK